MEIQRPVKFGLWGKDNNDVGDSWLYILGCILTAFALSVGAPFWFDLLNRLIKLRGAGVKEASGSESNKNKPVG